ncbi:tripartite tricarboxylate transporter substrate binding protein [Ramlibacter sp.]|uniref:tripartite tricarboxylate transporter substrate binding protein n=1 Tax=Ramlibacter sp. TaxID=1917967 RepID=UPI002CE26449|nr:tripartite tricarboxylate transporter substrate binding protein [Ramlibacter sp.]HWI82502.1 tripartite tricarboxylate transporter substrate binding protein [Ramlibacter sp.]
MNFAFPTGPRSLSIKRWALALLAGGALAAAAQDFPAKPVELTVLFPAGSSADVVARVLADGMSKQLGQPVTVVNRPGAGGAIGYKYVYGQKPDGYSMVFNSNSISTVHYSGLTPFDYKAFDPVARVTVELPVVAVKGDSPWNSLKDLVEYARQKPGALKVGNSGLGSHTHITGVGFFNDQRVEVSHVPFGQAQVVTSLLGGHIDAVVQLPGALAPLAKAGNVKVLGVLASQREPAFPNVPTAIEQGMKFQADMWRGIAVPRGTPKPVVARLEQAVRAAVNTPEFRAQGEKLGFAPAFQPATDFGPTIAADDQLLARAMEKAGLRKTQ